MFKCYIISLPSRQDRRDKMKNRMDQLKLKYEFIDAFTPDSEEVKYLGQGYDFRSSRLNPNLKCTLGNEFSCFASHLESLRRIMNSEVPGIVLEDDAVLHKDFVQLLNQVDLTNLNLLMLYTEPMCNERGPGLYNIDHNNWGAVGFWCSADYAKEAYNRFHKPFISIDFGIKTSEAITMCSRGKFIIPQLCLEDPMNLSCLRDPTLNNGYHLEFDKYIDWKEYVHFESPEYKLLLDNYFNYMKGNPVLYDIDPTKLDLEQKYIHFKCSNNNEQLDSLVKNNPKTFWWVPREVKTVPSVTPVVTVLRPEPVIPMIPPDPNGPKIVRVQHAVIEYFGDSEWGLYLKPGFLELQNIEHQLQNVVRGYYGPRVIISLSDEPGAFLYPRSMAPDGTPGPRSTDTIQGPVLFLKDPINDDLTESNGVGQLNQRIIRTKKNHKEYNYSNYLTAQPGEYKKLLTEFLGHYIDKKVSNELFSINIEELTDIQKLCWYDLVLIHSFKMNKSFGVKACKDFLKFSHQHPDLIEPRIEYFSKNMEYYLEDNPDKKSMLMLAFSGLEYNPDSVKKGIFGSEEAVIYLTEELSSTYQITVLTGGPNKVYSLPFNNPRYMKTLVKQQRFDIGVLWRNYYDIKSICDKVWTWQHDVYMSCWTRPRLLEMDRVFLLSEWHREQFQAQVDLSGVNVVICGNGIIPRDFSIEVTGPRTCTNLYSFVYTSCYARGLIHLLKWWPEIKEKYPEATLDLCYGWYLWNQPKNEQDELKAEYEKVKHLDITDHGTVGHQELIKILKRSSIWAYPCIFYETFCITAVKMQACGVVPIVNKIGALKETVDFGFECERIEDYKELLFKSLESMRDSVGEDWASGQRNKMSKATLDKWSWSKVAEHWV